MEPGSGTVEACLRGRDLWGGGDTCSQSAHRHPSPEDKAREQEAWPDVTTVLKRAFGVNYSRLWSQTRHGAQHQGRDAVQLSRVSGVNKAATNPPLVVLWLQANSLHSCAGSRDSVLQNLSVVPLVGLVWSCPEGPAQGLACPGPLGSSSCLWEHLMGHLFPLFAARHWRKTLADHRDNERNFATTNTCFAKVAWESHKLTVQQAKIYNPKQWENLMSRLNHIIILRIYSSQQKIIKHPEKQENMAHSKEKNNLTEFPGRSPDIWISSHGH